jgi:hypothetical protein
MLSAGQLRRQRRQRLREQRLRQARERSRNLPGIPLHPLLLDRFNRILSQGIMTTPPDLGLAPIGTLRPITGDFFDSRKSFLLNLIWSQDRTLTEWLALIEQYETVYPSHLWSISLLNKDNPWFRHQDNRNELEKFFYQNQKMRWICRKWIAIVRERIMKKRIIGDVDLYTLKTIPLKNLIQIYDTKTRSCFHFHALTLYKCFMLQIYNQSYGIANPQIPKNPYTNIPWSIGQLIRIIEQLSIHFILNHRLLPSYIQDFRAVSYDIKKFHKRRHISLNIDAANNFLSNKHDVDAQEILLEIYDDISSAINIELPERNIVRNLFAEKRLSTNLEKRWTQILISHWIYTNHSLLYKTVSLEQIYTDFKSLVAESYQRTLIVESN